MEFFVYETGETIKARHRPVIIITSDMEVERELSRADAEPSPFPVHVLFKPLDSEEFAPLARKYLDPGTVRF